MSSLYEIINDMPKFLKLPSDLTIEEKKNVKDIYVL